MGLFASNSTAQAVKEEPAKNGPAGLTIELQKSLIVTDGDAVAIDQNGAARRRTHLDAMLHAAVRVENFPLRWPVAADVPATLQIPVVGDPHGRRARQCW